MSASHLDSTPKEIDSARVSWRDNSFSFMPAGCRKSSGEVSAMLLRNGDDKCVKQYITKTTTYCANTTNDKHDDLNVVLNVVTTT